MCWGSWRSLEPRSETLLDLEARETATYLEAIGSVFILSISTMSPRGLTTDHDHTAFKFMI
jgi:hypothetical protein